MTSAITLASDPQTGLPIVYNGTGNVLVTALTGKGKSTGIVIPNLIRRLGGSCLFTDFNLDLTKMIPWREMKGHKCYVLDFLKVVHDRHLPRRNGVPFRALYNPIDFIRKARSPISSAMMISEALIPNEGGPNSYFAVGAHGYLTAFNLHVALDDYYLSCPQNRHLGETWRILGDPKAMLEALACMLESGDPYRIKWANAILNAPSDDREISGFLNHITVNVGPMLSDPYLIEAMRETTIPFDRMNKELMSVSLVCPGDDAAVLMRLIRMITSCCLSEIERGGRRPHDSPQGPTLLILDEFHVLGNFERFLNALARLRGFGVQCMMLIQNMTQLKVYKDQWEGIPGTSGIVQYFGGTGDPATSNFISALIGKFRLWRPTQGTSQSSSGTSNSQSYTTEFQDYLRPDQVASLAMPQTTITYIGEQTVIGHVIHPSLNVFPDYLAFQTAIEEGYTPEEAMAFSDKVCADIDVPMPPPAKIKPQQIKRKKLGLLQQIDRFTAWVLGDDDMADHN